MLAVGRGPQGGAVVQEVLSDEGAWSVGRNVVVFGEALMG